MTRFTDDEADAILSQARAHLDADDTAPDSPRRGETDPSAPMTLAEPSVSTDASFLTMALRFAIRCSRSCC